MKRLAALLTVLALPLTLASCERRNDIASRVDRVRNEPSTSLRTALAQRLADAIRAEDKGKITDSDIDALAGMMTDRDDSVRYWIAVSLGFIGTRAKRAAPQLQRAFRDIACIRGSLTSEPAIRQALSRIGADVPESHCK
jgi:hypothetical protein